MRNSQSYWWNNPELVLRHSVFLSLSSLVDATLPWERFEEETCWEDCRTHWSKFVSNSEFILPLAIAEFPFSRMLKRAEMLLSICSDCFTALLTSSSQTRNRDEIVTAFHF